MFKTAARFVPVAFALVLSAGTPDRAPVTDAFQTAGLAIPGAGHNDRRDLAPASAVIEPAA